MDVGRDVTRLFKRRRQPRSGLRLAGAVGIGVGAMYLLDPDRGARRRALVRDKSVHALHRASDLMDKSMRDLSYRARGLVAETRSLTRHEAVTDETLVQRVRSRMGRAVSHPHAVEVSARDGRITLRGLVLVNEVPELLSCVEGVPGVTGVDNQLHAHTREEAVPALQGERHPQERAEVKWSPLLRVAVGTLGSGLIAWGLSRRDAMGTLLAGGGAALLARDVADRPLRHVLGIGTGARAVDFHKTITVRAPIGDVFAFFSSLENFPRFMTHLKEVRRTGDGRYRWVATGPAGIPVSWDAEITELTPEKVLAWRSLPGALVQNEGVARFEETPEGSTRLDIRMSYNPPAGALGHLVASLFGSDPKHAMDEDLVRFQSILERGKTTAHGAEVRFGDLRYKPS